jgi:uncharacterized protein (DUF2267 family)
MTATSFYRRVMADVGVEREKAERATAAVLHALRDRLTPEEARQAVAQLPRELKEIWASGERLGRTVERMHRRSFYDRVRGEARLTSMTEARDATRAVFGALKEQISPGEADDILAQLPRDLKEIWERA